MDNANEAPVKRRIELTSVDTEAVDVSFTNKLLQFFNANFLQSPNKKIKPDNDAESSYLNFALFSSPSSNEAKINELIKSVNICKPYFHC